MSKEINHSSTIEISCDIKEEAFDSVLGELISHKVITQEQALSFLNEEDPEELEIDICFEGSVVPYDSGSREQPPEGGYCEDEYVYIESECPIRIARSKQYKEMAQKIRAFRKGKDLGGAYYKRSEMFARRFETKSEVLVQLDITEYLTQSSIDGLNEGAYESAVDDYCEQWEDRYDR